MNKKIKEDWVKALRSGEYAQGKGELHNKEDNTFCCLGVLCDLYLKAKGLTWDDKTNIGTSLPTAVVTDWAEMPLIGKDDWKVEYKNQSRWLEHLNDKEHSFETIAKLIEEQL